MTPSPLSTTHRRPRGGFSLVELLLVIAIIGVLIAILVPTVTSMRKTAQAASSQQAISTLSSAIDRYFTDFRAYPGVFSNDVIAAGGPKLLVPSGPTMLTAPSVAGFLPGNITQSENLVLSLLGGLNVNPAGTTFVYDPDLVGGGARSLNPMKPKTFAPYAESGEAQIGPKPYVVYAGVGSTNSHIPEFLDAYGSETMPVVYLRARVGAQFPVGSGNTFQYDPIELDDYGFMFGAGKDFVDAAAYLTHPSIPNTPVNKDGYILIAAGKDRKYGTKDDLTNFGSFK
jgi:prepilin-type N-terminal cleavage/methylation domain-containing protein